MTIVRKETQQGSCSHDTPSAASSRCARRCADFTRSAPGRATSKPVGLLVRSRSLSRRRRQSRRHSHSPAPEPEPHGAAAALAANNGGRQPEPEHGAGAGQAGRRLAAEDRGPRHRHRAEDQQGAGQGPAAEGRARAGKCVDSQPPPAARFPGMRPDRLRVCKCRRARACPR